MKRMLCAVAVAVSTFALTTGAAGAAPPMRESGTSTNLYSNGSECSTTSGAQTCTSTYLDAWTDTGSGSTWVCVSVERYTIRGDRYRSDGYESGCTESSTSLTVDPSFNASLGATSVPLFASDCDRRTCTERATRTVTVSASESASGPASSSSGKGSFTEGNCTYRYSYTSSGAPVSGSFTIDGVAHAHEGWAGQNTYRSTQSCK